IRKILTWVRLPKLPIHYFNQVAVTRIGNYIKKTARLDLATAEGARARYARVCVEVDLSKPLLEKYMIEDRTLLIEYESLDNICFTCGVCGHKTDGCIPKPPSLEEVRQEEAETGDGVKVANQAEIADWMTVTHRNKNKKATIRKPVQKTDESCSRFTALQGVSDVPSPDSEARSISVQVEDINSIIADHASKLAIVLSGGLQGSNKSTVPNNCSAVLKSAGKATFRSPLADVSNNLNLRKKGKGLVGVGKESGGDVRDTALVSVPVTYHNPIFQGAPSAVTVPKSMSRSSRKDKGVVKGRQDKVSKPELKAGRQVHNFGSCKADPKAASGTSTVAKAGKPPDRS
ncbi:hypothetical protein LINPERHAP2_LOCUS4350, partial [Linum perenne]